MKIKSIRFRNVGPFGAAGIRLDGFTPGLNVVCETNEFGKSTVLKALEIILFKPFSSTDKHVKALRTENADAGPEGEIRFSSDGKEYQFSKIFLKAKGARLQDAQTGEVLAVDRAAEEALAKHLRSDRFEGGPSGLLWVRQGRSMEGVSDDGQVASRLEGELGTLIGGDRARAYLTRVETELAEDLTPRGQEKKSGPLRMARDAVVATQAELAEALRLRETTTSIGVELAQVTAEIDILDHEAEIDNHTQDINKIQLAMNAARHFKDGLELLKAKQAEAEAAAKRASTRQAEYISALVSYNSTAERLTDLADNQQVKSKALEEIVLRRDDIREKISNLEARLDELDQIRSRRDAFTLRSQRLEILQKDMQQLGAYLEQYEALKNQQSKLTDQISDLPVVTRKDVETLRLATDDVRQYEMELAALSTHLYLDLTPNGAGKISLNGKPLKAGPIELPGGAALKIDGIGELRSDDSQLRATRRKLDQARQAHMALLDRYSVSDTVEASKFADQRHDLEEERKRVTSDMARLAPEGLTAIETNFSLADTEARSLAEQLTDAQAELGDADDKHVMEELRAERAKFAVIEETLTAAHQSLADIKTEQARLGERVKSLNLAKELTERNALADKLAGEKLKAEAKARSMMTEVTDQKSKAPVQSLDMLEARLTRLQQSSNNARQKLESLKTKQAGLQARRDAAFEGGDADAIVTSLKARLETEQNMLSRRVRSKDVRLLLQKTLIETQNRLRDAYTAPVTQELTPLLSHVFPGAEAGLGDSLGVDTVLRDGKLEKISQLSGGTQEQFAILTRLAYARLLTRNGTSAPVILDDALVYADDARRDAMFDVLGLVSTGQNPIQIVYLSCHAAASRRLGGNRITPQPW